MHNPNFLEYKMHSQYLTFCPQRTHKNHPILWPQGPATWCSLRQPSKRPKLSLDLDSHFEWCHLVVKSSKISKTLKGNFSVRTVYYHYVLAHVTCRYHIYTGPAHIPLKVWQTFYLFYPSDPAKPKPESMVTYLLNFIEVCAKGSLKWTRWHKL